MKRKTFDSIINITTYGTWIPYTIYSAYEIMNKFDFNQLDKMTNEDTKEFILMAGTYGMISLGIFYVKETINRFLKHTGQSGKDIAFPSFKKLLNKDDFKNDMKAMFGIDEISQQAKKEYEICKKILESPIEDEKEFQREFTEKFSSYLKTKCKQKDFEERYGFTYHLYELFNKNNLKMYFFKGKYLNNTYDSLEMLITAIEEHSINKTMYRFWKDIKNKHDLGKNTDIVDSLIKEYSGYKIKDKNKEIRVHLENRLETKELNPFSNKKKTYGLSFAPMENQLYVMKKSNREAIEKEAAFLGFLGKIKKQKQSDIKIPIVIEKEIDDADESKTHIIMQSMHGTVLENYLKNIDDNKKTETITKLIFLTNKFFKEAYEQIKILGYEIEEKNYTYELNEKIYHSRIKDNKALRSETTFFFDELNQLPKTMIHGDFHPGNVIFWKDYFSIIDFEDAAIGNEFTDACCMLEQPWNQKPDENLESVCSILINERKEYKINRTEIKRLVLKNSCYEDLNIFLKRSYFGSWKNEKKENKEWMTRALQNFNNYFEYDISRNEAKQAEGIIKVIKENISSIES